MPQDVSKWDMTLQDWWYSTCKSVKIQQYIGRSFLFSRCGMYGYLESVTDKGVKGWAVNKKLPGKPVRVRIMLGKKVLTELETDRLRTDVGEALSIEAGDYGFSVAVKIPSDKIDTVSAEAFDGVKWSPIKSVLKKSVAVKKKSGYQTFDTKGGSDSHGKLKSLRLSDLVGGKDDAFPLKGKSVLDIGCNEGFFCLEAVKQGARRVLGIDYSQHYIDLAKVRCPEAEFRKATWWEIPDEKFDVIFFLSAIHYEADQKKLLTKLLDHLTPDGVLVLECGVAPGDGQGAWKTIVRWDAERKYPHRDYLINVLLSDYATRLIGGSVNQSGDPIPRMVFHCRPKRGTAIIVAGSPYAGKTTLVRDMKRKGFETYSTDLALRSLVSDPYLKEKEISQALVKEFGKNSPVNLGKVGKFVQGSAHVSEFVDYVISELPLEVETFLIEGEALVHETVRTELTEKLKARGVRVWNMNLS
jgi:SAM-dependent methyltransferase